MHFFKELRKHPELILPIREHKKEGLYYSGFAKIRTVEDWETIGVDGGRDGFGSSAHMDSKGNIIIAISNGGAGDMDALTVKTANIVGKMPFSGDPTRKGYGKFRIFFYPKQHKQTQINRNKPQKTQLNPTQNKDNSLKPQDF